MTLYPLTVASPDEISFSPVSIWNVDVFPAPFTPKFLGGCITAKRNVERKGHLVLFKNLNFKTGILGFRWRPQVEYKKVPFSKR